METPSAPAVDPAVLTMDEPLAQAAGTMQADIAIVGGGLAGSMAAAMLGRAGHEVILIDPNAVYPPEFRCEKLEQGHFHLLRSTKLAEAVTRVATRTDTLWVARFGRVVDKMPFDQYGLSYETLVNAMRGEIPARVVQRRTRALAVEAGAERQRIRLAGGGLVEARLTILASGLNWSLQEQIGIRRDLVSPCHSITIGFDIVRADGTEFDFPALQYNQERVGNGVAYLTLFRIGKTMRANLFLYGALKSPQVAAFRDNPAAALHTLLPRLKRLTGPYAVSGRVRIWPTNLHRTQPFERPGLVMIGDAFTTPCPATGTGALRVMNDVALLCDRYVPEWLATPGIGADKIAAYYADPIKVACDTLSVERAYRLRALSIGTGPYWTIQRSARFGWRLVRWSLRSSRAQIAQLAAWPGLAMAGVVRRRARLRDERPVR